MDVRRYTPADLASVQRIWLECGWFDSIEAAAALEPFLAEATTLVAVMDGDPECAVSTHRGHLSYQGEDLELCHVSSVTTSWIGRKRGLASELTARAIRSAADDGAEIAILGMFEQGFYDRLGFGTGPYEHQVRFDPASLRVPAPYRTPQRFSPEDDAADLAAALWNRTRPHGGVRIDGDRYARAEFSMQKSPFALGYRDASGAITHFVLGSAKGESGPYSVTYLAYRSTAELLELMAVLQSLGDQVRTVAMAEPPEIQLQDLLDHPVRSRISTRKSEHEATTRSGAWWQTRILDLEAVVSKRHWAGSPVSFNLLLGDPLSEEAGDGWPGLAGSWVVEIGDESSARRGKEPALPTLTASINAFSRMWTGARAASSLAVTDMLSGPPDLLSSLDEALSLPIPRPGIYL